MSEFLEFLISPSMLPASVILILTAAYWSLVVLGSLDIDVFNFDADVQAGGGSFTSIGFVALRFLNIADVPLMIWISVFAFVNWILSASLNHWLLNIAYGIPLTIAGSIVLAALLTKFLTIPLKGKFEFAEPPGHDQIVGQFCRITHRTDDRFGRAELPTEGAPLLLNVRCPSGSLEPGERATIIGFDPHFNVYIVQRP